MLRTVRRVALVTAVIALGLAAAVAVAMLGSAAIGNSLDFAGSRDRTPR